MPTQCDECAGDDDTASLDLTQSSSYKETNAPFQATYGSGAVQGVVASDTVTVGNLTVAEQYFGSVGRASRSFLGTPSSGLLGLAFPYVTSSLLRRIC